MKKSKANSNIKKRIVNFLKTPYSIIIYLSILVVVLLIFNLYIAHRSKLYVFNGYNDNITFLSGSIYLGGDINNFTSPTIIYSKDDILLKTYDVGYYVKKNKQDIGISVTNRDAFESADELVSLKELLRITEFSFTEYSKEAKFFSKENVNLLDSFYFKIFGKDKDDNLIELEIPLEIEKVSK